VAHSRVSPLDVPRATFSAESALMRPFDLGYLMGLVVGEGSFTTNGPFAVLALRLHARDPVPLRTLREGFGGVVYGPYRHGGRHYMHWRLSHAELRRVLPLFDVYLPASYRREQYVAWRRRYFADVPIAVAGDAVLLELGC
jgi:hypothetical protein